MLVFDSLHRMENVENASAAQQREDAGGESKGLNWKLVCWWW